ncbi:MAG: hypothetical protein QM831_28895 [Kofleriaceae bacterium]
MKTQSVFASLLFVSAAVACGGDDGGKNNVTTHDSGTGSNGSGSGSGSCTADADYGAADFGSASDQFASYSGSGSDEFETWGGLLNDDADELDLELYAGGTGVFATGIKTGTFPITGDDAQYKTCAVCVRIYTDEDFSGSDVTFKDHYFASSGTVTLTAVSGNTFSGTLSNIGLDHVTIGSDFTSTPVGDCTSKITSGTMMTDLTMDTGSGGSAAAAPASLRFHGKVHWKNGDANRLSRRHF